MATYYVDDGGDNTTGADWSTAFQSITNATVLGAAAGSTIIVGHNHTEGLTGSQTFNFTGGTIASPVKVVSATQGSSPAAYQKGALIDSTSGTGQITWDGHVIAEGLVIASENYNNIGSKDKIVEFRDCTLRVTKSTATIVLRNVGDSSAFKGGTARFYNCVFDWTGSACSGLITLGGGARVEIIGGSVVSGTSLANIVNPIYSTTYGHISRVWIEGLDISGLGTSNMLADYGCELILRRCELPTSYALAGTWTGPHGFVLLENCAVGTITAPPLGLTEYEDYYGTIKADSGRVRSGGATDGETAYSLEMSTASTALELFEPLVSPWMVLDWIDGGSSVTVTIYVASGASLYDDDFWIEIMSPDETASPNQTATGNYYSSRGTALDTTPTILTTDGVDGWSGTGTGTPQKISRTFTPTEAGPVSVRLHLAKPSTTIYVDPVIEVT